MFRHFFKKHKSTLKHLRRLAAVFSVGLAIIGIDHASHAASREDHRELQTPVGMFSQRVDKANTRINGANARINSAHALILETNAATNARINSANAQIDRANARIDRANERINKAYALISGAYTEINKAYILILKTNIATNARLDEAHALILEKDVATNARIDELTESVNALAAAVSELLAESKERESSEPIAPIDAEGHAKDISSRIQPFDPDAGSLSRSGVSNCASSAKADLSGPKAWVAPVNLFRRAELPECRTTRSD